MELVGNKHNYIKFLWNHILKKSKMTIKKMNSKLLNQLWLT